MTAFHIIRLAKEPIELFIVNDQQRISKGVAYAPYSKQHLLNVVAGKMSAFPDVPDHFLDWIMKREEFINKDRSIIAISFLPRHFYGVYLEEIYKTILDKKKTGATFFSTIESRVFDIELADDHLNLKLGNGQTLVTDFCILAIGNHLPRNPAIKNNNFYKSEKYFRNPWYVNSVSAIDSAEPVVIIGNGLTMVDTVIGLVEQGWDNMIYSISPNGFNILPHTKNHVKYTGLTDELQEDVTLLDVVRLVNKHRKILSKQGILVEAVIDSLRPYTHKIWKKLSDNDRKKFMARLRHMWGVARHRIPAQLFDQLDKLINAGKLHIVAGKLLDVKIENDTVIVEYFDKEKKTYFSQKAARVINCTGPETDISRLAEDNFLKKCLQKGILYQDELKLGIRTNTETFRVMKKEGGCHNNLFTLGNNLKGELWESTAVNELRMQAKNLAERITSLL